MAGEFRVILYWGVLISVYAWELRLVIRPGAVGFDYGSGIGLGLTVVLTSGKIFIKQLDFSPIENIRRKKGVADIAHPAHLTLFLVQRLDETYVDIVVEA
ncbi:hypothetical protein Tco_0957666 [Tanacetum coccineum]